MSANDERSVRDRRRGFTLIEVLIAMVILAVGLLALEAMGIGAARMVARADRQSEYTSVATERLERTLTDIRINGTATGGIATENGAEVATVVTTAPAGTRQMFTVSVTVTPPPAQGLNLQPITVVGRELR